MVPFDEAIADPNARVQADDAKLAKAEVLYLLASLSPQDPDGYKKALDAFREVERKADLIPIQQATVDKLKQENQAEVQGSGGMKVNAMRNQIIEREESRLDTLKTEPDPILQALIRIAQCYNAMLHGDEARTVLHPVGEGRFDCRSAAAGRFCADLFLRFGRPVGQGGCGADQLPGQTSGRSAGRGHQRADRQRADETFRRDRSARPGRS